MIEREKDLAEKDRSKLHVNTKRPVHDDPDRYYTVTRFIDLDKHLFDPSKGKNYYERPDIGVFVVSLMLLRRNSLKIKSHFSSVQFSANKKYFMCHRRANSFFRYS